MPARPRLAGKEAAEVRFPTWDEMVAEATVDLPPYQLPLGKDDVVEIPCPTGDSYLEIVAAQRVGDAPRLLTHLIPDAKVRERVRIKMRGADWPIIDLLGGKVLSYYFGLGTGAEAEDDDPGNSSAS